MVVDIDRVLGSLSGLREGRSSSQKTCETLLDGWNTLEDLARSVHMNVRGQNKGEKEILQNAYDKLFFGNNLPSVTPVDRCYNPIFSLSERKAMRMHIRHLWRCI